MSKDKRLLTDLSDLATYNSYPASIYLIKSNYRNTRKICEICSKLTRMTLITSFWCLYCQLCTDLTYYSDVSIADFEQVNASWVEAKYLLKVNSKCIMLISRMCLK